LIDEDIEEGHLRADFGRFTPETVKKLENPGCLLASAKNDGICNVMTIGWGLVGVFWRMPVFLVAVRHSRFTHEFIEESGEFTVNVPDEGMEKALSFCGQFSGRDHDKFKESKITPMKSKNLKTPVIRECTVHYECKVVYQLEVKPNQVPIDVKKLLYSKGDFHTLYFGRILAVY
jgi:flavin reductase (DIM6/NTAB) family NADH-FMN oxidoreductase RutF